MQALHPPLPPCTPGTRGYSLIEVVFASAIFLFGVAAAYTGVGITSNMSRNALMRQKASALAHTVANNLLVQGSALIPGSSGDPGQLLVDWRQAANRAQELLCNGNAFYPFCDPDYPRSGGLFLNDLTRVLGDVAIITGTDPMAFEVRYQGATFRVYWNIVDNQPLQGQKTVSVLVTWPPYGGTTPGVHAVMQGRFVQVTFSKGRGL